MDLFSYELERVCCGNEADGSDGEVEGAREKAGKDRGENASTNEEEGGSCDWEFVYLEK